MDGSSAIASHALDVPITEILEKVAVDAANDLY
jgi:carbamoylphosphate synthase large subunit